MLASKKKVRETSPEVVAAAELVRMAKARGLSVLTEASGHVPIEVPRDREGSFEPQIVKKRRRRLSGVDEIVLSL